MAKTYKATQKRKQRGIHIKYLQIETMTIHIKCLAARTLGVSAAISNL